MSGPDLHGPSAHAAAFARPRNRAGLPPWRGFRPDLAPGSPGAEETGTPVSRLSLARRRGPRPGSRSPADLDPHGPSPSIPLRHPARHVLRRSTPHPLRSGPVPPACGRRPAAGYPDPSQAAQHPAWVLPPLLTGGSPGSARVPRPGSPGRSRPSSTTAASLGAETEAEVVSFLRMVLLIRLASARASTQRLTCPGWVRTGRAGATSRRFGRARPPRRSPPADWAFSSAFGEARFDFVRRPVWLAPDADAAVSCKDAGMNR